MQASSLLPECLNNCAVAQCHHCDLGHYAKIRTFRRPPSQEVGGLARPFLKVFTCENVSQSRDLTLSGMIRYPEPIQVDLLSRAPAILLPARPAWLPCSSTDSAADLQPGHPHHRDNVRPAARAVDDCASARHCCGSAGGTYAGTLRCHLNLLPGNHEKTV